MIDPHPSDTFKCLAPNYSVGVVKDPGLVDRAVAAEIKVCRRAQGNPNALCPQDFIRSPLQAMTRSTEHNREHPLQLLISLRPSPLLLSLTLINQILLYELQKPSQARSALQNEATACHTKTVTLHVNGFKKKSKKITDLVEAATRPSWENREL